MRSVLVRLILLSTVALGAGACAPLGPGSDVLQLQGDCNATHSKVGQTATLSRRAHNVGGTVEVVDDCTLVIHGFTYDGGGLDVRLYAAEGNQDFADGTALTGNFLGKDSSGADKTVKLPVGVSLDQVDRISVWCVLAREDFGSGTLAP